MNNHSLPHKCDAKLKRLVLIKLQSQREEQQQTLVDFFAIK